MTSWIYGATHQVFKVFFFDFPFVFLFYATVFQRWKKDWYICCNPDHVQSDAASAHPRDSLVGSYTWLPVSCYLRDWSQDGCEATVWWSPRSRVNLQNDRVTKGRDSVSALPAQLTFNKNVMVFSRCLQARLQWFGFRRVRGGNKMVHTVLTWCCTVFAVFPPLR